MAKPTGNPTGKPKLIKTPEEFNKKVDAYFKNAKRPTLNGLVLHLGFSHKQGFYNYAKYDGFFDCVKRAQTLIERNYEESMLDKPAGSIFALKNFGWTDRQEVTHKEDISSLEQYEDVLADIKKLKDELDID